MLFCWWASVYSIPISTAYFISAYSSVSVDFRLSCSSVIKLQPLFIKVLVQQKHHMGPCLAAIPGYGKYKILDWVCMTSTIKLACYSWL
jgi:hypothetical protein